MKREKEISLNFSSYIRELRNNKGLSLKEVEQTTGISASYVNRLERGERLSPSINMISSLARCYGRNPTDLFQIAVESNSKEDNEEVILFETMIYKTNFLLNNMVADIDTKDSIVSIIKLVASLKWNSNTKYAEIGEILKEVDKCKVFL